MLAIYCRISQEKIEGKDRSINDQKLLGVELAKSLNLSYEVYIDEGISGTKDIKDRPAFASMLDDIADGKISHVYAYDQSRLERSPETRFIFKRLLKENNVLLYTDNGLVDTESDEGEMMGDFLSIINQYYARITARKIKSVLKRNAKEGKAHAKVMPFGYMKDEGGYLVINHEEAKIVKEIYSKSLAGIGSSTIKNWLNDSGVPTKYSTMGGTLTTTNRYTGKKTVKDKKDIIWSDKQVQDMLKNPIYKGKRKWGKEYYDCPAIFDADYWHLVNDNLPKNKKHSGKKVNHLYLLKGILECGKCGRNMYGRKRINLKDNAYICSSKRIPTENCKSRGINIDYLEDFIFNRFLKGDRLLELVKSSLEINDSQNNINKLEEKSIKIQKELESLAEQRKKAIRLALMDEILEADIEPELKRIRQRKGDKEVELNKLKNELQFLSKGVKITEDIRTDIDSIRDNIPFNAKRELIHKYIRRIIISYWEELGEHIIEVRFNIPINTEQFITNRKGRIAENANQLENLGFSEIEGIWYGNSF
ncbi:recombinase family protein [Maribacter sp. 1_2014MBL_MicDiv]|uniref:recombinase family protein n=1 Tax=Maribacter sp. 1_2014MBL_MicDiv TaxID=1644130 RepID=UPI0008F48078|nr:recombinase family protein [Maribacter sp. 1_2014MBL_MicDiv]APA65643.1 hypothetical protein YQ22_15775 [Maribacter sp. 1_2014MBL_MicDiv]